jgi:hypothetical protein
MYLLFKKIKLSHKLEALPKECPWGKKKEKENRPFDIPQSISNIHGWIVEVERELRFLQVLQRNTSSIECH